MVRGIRHTLLAIGLLVLVGGGASIFRMPEEEVLYSASPPITTCLKSGDCLFIYTLEVGNTGREAQEDVRVRLRRDVVQAAIMPLKVRSFGKVDRRFETSDADGVRTFDLGRLKAQQRVEISFVLRYPDRSQAPSWQQILVGVEAARGEVRPGDPAAVTLGRMLYRIFPWG
jgi:hypothetical protein